MPVITTTLSDLRSYSLTQIRTLLANRLAGLTKKQLILLALALQTFDIDEDPDMADESQFAYAPDGQWRSRLDVIRDAEGTRRASRGVVRTFTADGTTDSVVTVDYNASDRPIKRTTVQYYHDGRQPTVKVEE